MPNHNQTDNQFTEEKSPEVIDNSVEMAPDSPNIINNN